MSMSRTFVPLAVASCCLAVPGATFARRKSGVETLNK